MPAITWTAALATCIGLALSGCATNPPTRTASCNVHACQVVVTVNGCKISIDPETLTIMGREREIHWDIGENSSKSSTFAENGIVVKDFDPTREFYNPRRTDQNTKFILNDHNSFTKKYEYGINVMNGSVACPTYDPWIVNQ